MVTRTTQIFPNKSIVRTLTTGAKFSRDDKPLKSRWQGIDDASFNTAKVSTFLTTKHLVEACFECSISGYDNTGRHNELPDRLHRIVVEVWLAQLLQSL